ncbi:MAG: helix-turn-helix domain-containing protein [Rhodospirillales bacterium]
MQPSDFKRWRRSLGLSQKEAAQALGLKRRIIQYYEKGERDGEKVEVPKAVRLACYALSAGLSDYDGPDGKEGVKKKPAISRPPKPGDRRRPSDSRAPRPAG